MPSSLRNNYREAGNCGHMKTGTLSATPQAAGTSSAMRRTESLVIQKNVKPMSRANSEGGSCWLHRTKQTGIVHEFGYLAYFAFESPKVLIGHIARNLGRAGLGSSHLQAHRHGLTSTISSRRQRRWQIGAGRYRVITCTGEVIAGKMIFPHQHKT